MRGVGKSATRFAEFHQICKQKWGEWVNLQADFLTFTTSASRNGGLILPADLLTVTKPTSRQLPAEMVGDISASRFTHLQPICEQICWLSLHLQAEMRGVGKFASRFPEFHQICKQICWLLPNLPAEMREGLNLQADLQTFTKSASRNEGSR